MMAMSCDENKVLRLFRRAVQAPGGRRTSLSPNVRKSVASFEELKGVVSVAVYNSAVCALEAKVVERTQMDPGAKSKAVFLPGTSAA